MTVLSDEQGDIIRELGVAADIDAEHVDGGFYLLQSA